MKVSISTHNTQNACMFSYLVRQKHNRYYNVCAKSVVTLAAAYYCVKKIALKVQKYVMHYNMKLTHELVNVVTSMLCIYDRLTMDA